MCLPRSLEWTPVSSFEEHSQSFRNRRVLEAVAWPSFLESTSRTGFSAYYTGTGQLVAKARGAKEADGPSDPPFSWAAPPSAMSIMTQRSSWRAARRRQSEWTSWSTR